MITNMKGIYTQDRSDFGWFTTGENEVFFVGARNRFWALPGDKVEAFVIRRATEWQNAEVRIARVLERGDATLYGTLTKIGKNGALSILLDIPEGERIRIKHGCTLDARSWEAVGVKIRWIARQALAEITERLGKADSFAVEREITLRRSGLPLIFPDEVVSEASTLSREGDSAKQRLDCTKETIITIDGEDAKDLDDAIGVKLLANGHYHLSVHIADVAEYVVEGSSLDKEALKRTTSTYLSDRVIPMLPEKLSNDLCSLHPGEEKLCLAISMEIDQLGRVSNVKVFESVILSAARTTYNQVQSWHDRDGNVPLPSAAILDMIDRAYELASIVDKRRELEGKIELELAETKVRLDEKSEPVEIITRERKDSHRLIETFMILANEEVSRYFALHKIPFLYRIHEAPSSSNMEDIRKIFGECGVKIPDGDISPKMLRNAYEAFKSLKDAPPIEKTILSKLSKAAYSEKILGHYGLALKYYSHFTSPIRRYPDTQIHRIIKKHLRGELPGNTIAHFAKILPVVGKLTSAGERRAEALERDMRDLEIARFLESQVGTLYDWVVTGSSKYAYYVAIGNGIEWSVFLGKPGHDENFDFPPPGTKLRVRLEKVDRKYRRIDLVVIDADGNAIIRKRTPQFHRMSPPKNNEFKRSKRR